MPYNTFPPKFSSDITYPAILNLDELDMIDSPVGDVSLGTYFSVSFGYGYNDITPLLTYGKHGFKITINSNVEAFGYPRLRSGTRILFELKDVNGIVIFSDVTPFHASDNLKFMGYTWIKEDPLRTYEDITEGIGTMTIVGIADVNDNYWSRIYNVRSTLYLDLDYKIEEIVNNMVSVSYYDNLSPIIFKNIKKMGSGVVSGGGLFISESRIGSNEDDGLIDDISQIHISASHLKTYSGKLEKINVQYWLSGSSENDWQSLASVDNLSARSTVYEDDIHSDYSEGINPLSLIWTHALTATEVSYDETAQNKVKFKLTFADVENNLALNDYPFSGEPGGEFSLQYPSGSDNWLYITGSQDNRGEGGFTSGFNELDTMAGQFDLHSHGFGINRGAAGGQLFDSDGVLISWGGSEGNCHESKFGCGDPPIG